MWSEPKSCQLVVCKTIVHYFLVPLIINPSVLELQLVLVQFLFGPCADYIAFDTHIFLTNKPPVT